MFFYAAKTKYVFYLSAFAACLHFFYSCTTIKGAPKNKPFVYQTNINIEGEYKTEEKKELRSQLTQQLDDSLRVKRERKVLLFTTVKNPPVYDSANIEKSKIYMQALLNSLGYYRDSIIGSGEIKQVDDQQRVTVNFTVMPGKRTMIDSVWHDLSDSLVTNRSIDTLQEITNASLENRKIKAGDPFSKPLISAELDRLSDVYRNNGYLLFSRNQLQAVWDTIGRDLLRFTTDPAEQLRQLEALRYRRANPTAEIQVRLRPPLDSSSLVRYYVGTVKIFPDYNNDTAYYTPTIDTLTRNQYQFISYQRLFNPRKLIRFIHLDRGDLYKQSNYLRTQNKFNSIDAWRLVTITQIPRPGQDTVDFEIKLVPDEKYLTGINFDASINQSNIASLSNLLGLGINYSIINRNFIRGANKSTLNFRYGIELTSKTDNIQTQLFNVGYSINFPRLVPRFTWLPSEVREDARTSLSFNAANVDRLNYYNVSTVNASWGYEFPTKKMLVGVRFPNIEYNHVIPRDLLNQLIDSNKSFGYIFNDGLISSLLLNLTIASGKNISATTGKFNVTTVKRFGLEFAGIVSGLFRNQFFPESKLYRFIKADFEMVQTKKVRRTAFAWRAFGGIGYSMNFDENDVSNFYMPFFRQYFAGGPNSMRAWSVRKLGPGSALKSFNRNIAPERFGDIRLELNGEYRYYMTTVFGFPLEGALFVDMGNVWFRRFNEDFGTEGYESFKLGRLWRDIAIGTGTGFRLDFGFLKARFDFAWKAKDPSPDERDAEAQNKWFYKAAPRVGVKRHKTTGEITKNGAQFQLGINYPF